MTRRRKIFDSGESSKSAEKRAKKQREATIAAVLNEERGAGVRISDENSNSSLNESPIIEEASNDNTRTMKESSKNTQKKNRKPRGPNKISQDDRGKAIEVNFNERDQPIGKESIKLATYLGALVRENVPVTLEHWSKLSNYVEETLWTCVRQKFKLAESQRKMIVQKMGKHLRDYKSLLTKLIRDLSQGDDAPTELAIAKPRNLTSNEWAAFIKGRLSSEFNGRSKIFKEMRKKQYLPHTMSRKGYAHLEDDMRKKAAANGDKEVT
ncbi:hypothetical protein L1049_014762 [Liquidambar formosana]|uniref:Uncharacterized protein n=1 Tax=Liquidambar formosana TaxID=63359 RepID=A0AAP0RWK2_LIQFO